MKHYWGIYQEFFKTSLAEASSFRINSLLVLLVDIAFYLVNLGSIDLMFSHIQHIGVWDREQFMFFISFILVIDNIHMIFLSGNFWILAEDLKLGNLDFILLRPVSSIFIVFFRYIRTPSIFSGIVAWFFLFYFALEAQLSPLAWVLLPLMILLSFILMALIEFIIATAMFWTTEGFGINFLRMQLQTMARYPDFVYQKFTRRFFSYVLPTLLIASAPCRFLLDHHQWQPMLYFFIAIGLMAAVLTKVWKRALDHYESASS